jgi:hypothetical protein
VISGLRACLSLQDVLAARKNAYGSRTGDAYLDACGRNGGKPLCGSGLERFLPWNAVPADLRAWAQPPPLADTGTGRAHHGVAAANRSRRLSACL